jgi:hypothetical protein
MPRLRTDILLFAAVLTSCGGSGPRPHRYTDEAWLLGPLPRAGCFHVALVAEKRYRFVIDDVEYPRALGSGRVALIIHAVNLGDLQPRPILLARDRQLRFEAVGDASGAFEVTLFLVDGNGRESEPATLSAICDSSSEDL